ncbi:hypothetical protein OIB37_34740 [Streptomyces sp. NBC_00820]|nr:hypothetical protein OIB37_34740 [Streptomyces sp. NBC_00820]
MHETDRRIDLGDPHSRQKALRSWSAQVLAAMDGVETEGVETAWTAGL